MSTPIRLTDSELDAVVDCWGGGVIPSDPSQLTDKRPIAPIELSESISMPICGIFGNEWIAGAYRLDDREQSREHDVCQWHRRDADQHDGSHREDE